ncbi:MAG: hypothetical protein LBC92_00745 [Rickettsiales bacterium]|jgi:hypothetical protein|nr:hypothetical protein [Rickettsiales bacterium]
MSKMQNNNKNTFSLFLELLKKMSAKEIASNLFIHMGTLNRWLLLKKIPNNYYNDINRLLGNKYENDGGFREKDQFYTTKEISKYCFNKTLDVLKNLDINEKDYIFIEPSAGCCNFYNILPTNRRIGIDIDPRGKLANELIKINYLDYKPNNNKKYIVIGNPPFGLRGNLALRFINHSYEFADIVAFILPPLFNSTGKGVPMTRIYGYRIAYSEKLPLDSFEYPDGKKVNISTIFQVLTKINTDKIKIEIKKTCKTFAKVYSLSNGGTPSSTRNKKMLNECDLYLPSTCFSGMRIYKSFEELPNRRGYGIVFLKEREKLINLFLNTNWSEIAFLSTNNAVNLRTDLIENVIINKGFYDK